MKIEQKEDEMQTLAGSMITPAGAIFSGEATAMHQEIGHRMSRLLDEARRERLAAGHAGLRQSVGHAIIALGRAIHGLEPEPRSRTAIRLG